MRMLDTQQLLERLACLLRSESRAQLVKHGLQPIQFEALHYLSLCNRYSDTPMAVTEYLCQTKGTVSQTLKVLERKDLLRKIPDQKDKRVTRLEISATGRQLVNTILPSPVLQEADKLLNDKELTETNRHLTELLLKLQQANQFKTFGQCKSCNHHIRPTPGTFVCGLTKEPLSQAETQLICREHSSEQTVQIRA